MGWGGVGWGGVGWGGVGWGGVGWGEVMGGGGGRGLTFMSSAAERHGDQSCADNCSDQ